MLTAKAAVAGVMGWPVGHSRSPRLHGWWLDRYGIDGAYIPLAVPPGRVAEAVRALPALGLRGANVTVPHKEAVIAACDQVDPVARRIGAVNTLVVAEDGTIEGRNTDGFGFMENLRADRPDWRAGAGPAVVLGAGGAARAILVALADAGAPEIRLLNRTRDRAETLAAELGGPVRVLPWEERAFALDGAALVVNTTTQGMGGQPALDLDLGRLPPAALVTDIVYTPLHTPLLKAAMERGNPVVDGLGMLLHQARPGFEAWFGRVPEVTPELRRFVLEGL
ncbi:shikimate dehydrogenase [Skermanella sp. TT6]|uniref:Shikimate dehydrogenase (NADP(+)) n=1 Tax=Skermanella cutis TaxID=2775420 RepID=A0ABX7BEL5_9PROT|nr:shikimate dehydrogenase [Skermanella sp. TT6]QQP92637.1 shikimate dehydrogenase [Skermanella sp. TT6]